MLPSILWIPPCMEITGYFTALTNYSNVRWTMLSNRKCVSFWVGVLNARYPTQKHKIKLWSKKEVSPFDISQLWPFISYSWLFQWDYAFYKWGFVSTCNWYSSGHQCPTWMGQVLCRNHPPGTVDSREPGQGVKTLLQCGPPQTWCLLVYKPHENFGYLRTLSPKP
jgi:hypothetical protein